MNAINLLRQWGYTITLKPDDKVGVIPPQDQGHDDVIDWLKQNRDAVIHELKSELKIKSQNNFGCEQ